LHYHHRNPERPSHSYATMTMNKPVLTTMVVHAALFF
jgi:hypothetical protein